MVTKRGLWSEEIKTNDTQVDINQHHKEHNNNIIILYNNIHRAMGLLIILEASTINIHFHPPDLPLVGTKQIEANYRIWAGHIAA